MGRGSSAMERALRSRNRILEESPDNRLWLDAVEREVAELAIAVAAARRETVQRLAALIQSTRNDESPFPFATLSLEGDIDTLVGSLPAVDAEDRYRAILRDHRSRDRAAGRTLVGPQATDMLVRHGPKDIPAQSRLHGRAEGPAHRPRPRPRATRRQHDGHRAFHSARRGRGPSRSAPPGRACSIRLRPWAARSG